MRELNLPYAKCVYDTALLCTELFLILGNLHYKCNFTWGTDYKVHFNPLQHPQFWPQICVTGVEEISLHFTDGNTEVQRNGDKVQDHTHEDSQGFWLVTPCIFQYTASLHVPCTASTCAMHSLSTCTRHCEGGLCRPRKQHNIPKGCAHWLDTLPSVKTNAKRIETPKWNLAEEGSGLEERKSIFQVTRMFPQRHWREGTASKFA